MLHQRLYPSQGAGVQHQLTRSRALSSPAALFTSQQRHWQQAGALRSSSRCSKPWRAFGPSQTQEDSDAGGISQQQQQPAVGRPPQQQWPQQNGCGGAVASLQQDNGSSPTDPQQQQQPGSSSHAPQQPLPQQQQQPYPSSIQPPQPPALQQQSVNPQQQQQPVQQAAVAANTPTTSSSGSSASSSLDGAQPPHPQPQQPQPQQPQQQQQQQPWPPDVPWGLDTVVGVLSLWLLAYVAIGQVVMPAVLTLLDLERAAMSARELALLNLCVDCVQAALTLLMLAKCLGRYRPRTRGLFPLRWQQGRWLTWVAAGVGCFPVIDWVWKQGVSLLTGADIQSDMFQTQIELGLYTGDVITIGCYAVIVGVLAPLWEEVLFRGFLLPSLAKLVTPWPAVALTALLFAWLHSSSEAIMPLLLVALGCGALLVRFDNLLPPILLHGLYNLYVFANMAVQLYCNCGPVTASLSVSFGAAAVLLVAAAAVHWGSRRSGSSGCGSGSSSGGSGSSSSAGGSRGGESPPPALPAGG